MLTIPEPVWDTLLAAFAGAPPGHERVAYIDGIRFRGRDGTEHCIATTITVPDAGTTPFNFRVSPAAMARAGEHFTPNGLVRLAHVHTHGNACTRHSPTDDKRAYSQRDGALSLVLPHHATGAPSPAVASVHIREPVGSRGSPPWASFRRRSATWPCPSLPSARPASSNGAAPPRSPPGP